MARLNNAEAVHNWASYNEGRYTKKDRGGSNSIRYEGPILFSYRTPVARYWGDGKSGYVLFTNTKFGVTTTHHMNMAKRAVNGAKYPCFEVPHINQPNEQDNIDKLVNDVVEAERTAIKYYKNRSDYDTSVFDRNRTDHVNGLGKMPHWFAGAIANAYHRAETFSALAKVKPTFKLKSLERELEEVIKLRDEQWVIFMDPKAVARRERAAARREAKIALFGDRA
jgi:hypothetical protein